MKFSWPSPWVLLLCWSSSPHSEAVYSLDHHCITKRTTQEQSEESEAQDKVWGRVQSRHAPSRHSSSRIFPQEALWTLSFGGLWKLQPFGTIDQIRGLGWWIWPPVPLPSLQVRVGLSFSLLIMWWFSWQQAHPRVIKGLSKNHLIGETKGTWIAFHLWEIRRVSRALCKKQESDQVFASF